MTDITTIGTIGVAGITSLDPARATPRGARSVTTSAGAIEIEAPRVNDKGVDDKIVAVSVRDPWFADYHDKGQLPPHVLRQVRRFFEDYKVLEHKQVVVEDLLGPDEAVQIIRDALQLYRDMKI